MNRSVLAVVVMGGVVLSAFVCGSTVCGAEPGPTDGVLLQVHLPREVTVRDSRLRLGQVSAVCGVGPWATTASNIGLGRLSMPGQKLVLDRPTVLSRLASHGIPSEKVRLTGAEAVVVRREQEVIDGAQFIEMAESFLKRNPPVRSPHNRIVVSRPKEMVLPRQVANLQLVPRLVRAGARGYVRVHIDVVADGQAVGTRDIPFRLEYRCRKAVTTQEIAEGAVLTPENVKVEETSSDRPEPAGWRPPYGLVAARALPANVDIRSDMVGSAQPAVVIRRNETVVIRIDRPGLVVTAVGLALQQAQVGQYVKVRNTDSHRVIVCRVNHDGTVEPVL